MKGEQTRRFQPGYASEAPDEFAKVQMQTVSRPLIFSVGPWKLYVLLQAVKVILKEQRSLPPIVIETIMQACQLFFHGVDGLS